MQTRHLEGGFVNIAIDAAHAFRAIMTAMARPGTIQTITGARPPEALSPAAGAVILTLCDRDTPIYLTGALDCVSVRDWIAFHTGAPLSGPSDCAFALGSWEDLLPLSAYPIGTSEYPDRSATLIVETPVLSNTGTLLCGPGIADTGELSLPDTAAFRTNAALFPLGLDFILTRGDQLAAMPRSTKLLPPCPREGAA